MREISIRQSPHTDRVDIVMTQWQLRASPAPIKKGYGTPGGTRTPDARLRTPPLCPTELQGQKPNGGDSGARTRNLGIANAALSQLSYIPTLRPVTSDYSLLFGLVSIVANYRGRCQGTMPAVC